MVKGRLRIRRGGFSAPEPGVRVDKGVYREVKMMD